MYVRDVMSAPAISVRPETPLKEVARLFVTRRISGVPVVDADGAILGIVSEADFLIKERGARGEPASSWRPLAWLLGGTESHEEQAKVSALTAGEAMTSPAISIGPDRPLREAAGRMVDARVNRLPVVDDGKLIGLITRADLVRAYVRTDDELAHAISHDVVQETMWLDPRSIGVTVDEGLVGLTGTVDRRSTARILEKLIGQVDGVVGVTSHLVWDLDDSRLEAEARHGEPEPTAASMTSREHPRTLG